MSMHPPVERPRFLVVDDQIANGIARAIRWAGDSSIAGTVAEAEQLLFPEAPFQAVFIDVVLPDGSGLDLLASLRTSDSRNARIPALVLTGQPDLKVANAAFDLGAHYIEKPFTTERLKHFVLRACAALHIERTVDFWVERYGLTESERCILSLAARGLSRNAIASLRGRSENTLKHQLNTLYEKTLDGGLDEAVARLLREALEGAAVWGEASGCPAVGTP